MTGYRELLRKEDTAESDARLGNLEELVGSLQDYETETVDERDISGVAGQFLTTYFLGEETNAAQAAELAKYEMIGGGWRNAFAYLSNIRKVKAADVQNVARKYMRNLRFVVIGDPDAINRSLFLQGTGE